MGLEQRAVLGVVWLAGGRVAWVTGSSTGVGAATSLKLAKNGYDVVVHHGSSEDEASEVARRIGAEEVVAVGEDGSSAEAVRAWTPQGRGVDVVIEAVGLPQVWEEALRMVRKGAEVTLFGGAPKGTEIPVDTFLLHYSQLTIREIFHHTPYTAMLAYEFLNNPRFDAESSISGVESLGKVIEALERHGRQEGIKYEIKL